MLEFILVGASALALVGGLGYVAYWGTKQVQDWEADARAERYQADHDRRASEAAEWARKQAEAEEQTRRWWEQSGKREFESLAVAVLKGEGSAAVAHFGVVHPGWCDFANMGLYANGDPGDVDDVLCSLHLDKGDKGAFNTSPSPEGSAVIRYHVPGPRATTVLHRAGANIFKVTHHKGRRLAWQPDIDESLWRQLEQRAKEAP